MAPHDGSGSTAVASTAGSRGTIRNGRRRVGIAGHATEKLHTLADVASTSLSAASRLPSFNCARSRLCV
ncbi:MAG: hypothetical protein ABI639_10020 [Thermoanaerobaculia bacterium]